MVMILQEYKVFYVEGTASFACSSVSCEMLFVYYGRLFLGSEYAVEALKAV